jgi:hypothetical protein
VEQLQSSYLGFAVIRPFEPPLLGRTVLSWYPPDRFVAGLRVTTPSRDYKVHLAGVQLTVHGLAWQPQDRAVGACATVALWSMLHSSAFDDHHAIPTTAEITEAAHRNASLGSRVYPSAGLTTYQLFEAIKAQRLAPNVMEGDIALLGDERNRGFKPERFLATCAAFIRSGYPVLVMGMQIDHADHDEGGGLHAVCLRASVSRTDHGPTCRQTMYCSKTPTWRFSTFTTMVSVQEFVAASQRAMVARSG